MFMHDALGQGMVHHKRQMMASLLAARVGGPLEGGAILEVLLGTMSQM